MGRLTESEEMQNSQSDNSSTSHSGEAAEEPAELPTTEDGDRPSENKDLMQASGTHLMFSYSGVVPVGTVPYNTEGSPEGGETTPLIGASTTTTYRKRSGHGLDQGKQQEHFSSVEFATARKSLHSSTSLKGIRAVDQKRKLLTLSMVVLSVLVSSMCYSIQAPFYPKKAEEKGISASQYGFVFGIFQLIICITSPIYGKYISVIGPTFMFNCGVFITAVCTILFGFLDICPGGSTFLALSFIIRIVAAFGESGVYNAGYTIVPYSFPDSVATAVSMVETAFGLGAILGPALGGVLFEAGGFMLPFFVTGGVLILGSIITSITLPGLKLEEAVKDDRPSATKAIFLPGVLLMSLAVFVGSVSSGFILALLEPHIREFNLPAWGVGLVFVTNGTCYAAMASFWGRMMDKMGHYRLITGLCTLVCSMGFVFLGPAPFIPLANTLASVLVALVLHGAGLGGMVVGAYMGTINELTNNGFPNDLQSQGLAAGIFNCAFSFGAFVGPSIAGTLYDAIGFQYASLVVVCCLWLTVVLAFGCEGYVRFTQKGGYRKIES